MTRTVERYINLFTDFGFKKLFGEEPNKDLLMSFLNELLGDQEEIKDIRYLNNEKLGKHDGERKAVYDLYCSNDQGEKFIVEIQRVKQEFFKDRSVYYSTFAIQDQATKGKDWKYELKGVYTIAILDFSFDPLDQAKFEHRIKLMDVQTHQIFYNKLTFIYLEIPKFQKEIHELDNDYEKLFELAEIANMNEKDRSVYQESLKDYWDLKSAMNTYYKDGKEEGLEEGLEKGRKEGLQEGRLKEKMATAQIMLSAGVSIEDIIKFTKLTREEIEKLI